MDLDYEAEIRALAQRLAAVEKRAQAAEDHLAIANLQRIYGFYVDKSQWDHVADLFSRDATIEINGRGKFFGHERIREYMLHFGPPPPGLLMNHIQLQPVVTVAEDGQTAKCRLRAMMQVGRMGGEAMWGECLYENEYVKEDGVWKISVLKSWQTFYTDFDKGWAQHAMPLLMDFDDLPPDEKTTPYPVFPDYFLPPYHYRNPVSGRE